MQNECCMIARTLLSNPSEIIKHHNFWCKDTKKACKSEAILED